MYVKHFIEKKRAVTRKRFSPNDYFVGWIALSIADTVKISVSSHEFIWHKATYRVLQR
jgi:hypothetical protein